MLKNEPSNYFNSPTKILHAIQANHKSGASPDFRSIDGDAGTIRFSSCWWNSLSLLKGHRISIDIDLFTSNEYGSTDFGSIELKIKNSFPIVENPEDEFPALKAVTNNSGFHLMIGYSSDALVKTDILYWEPFLFDAMILEGIRMATIEEIGTMKLDVISRGGRKKDFWDLVEIFNDYPLVHLINLYQKKYPNHHLDDVTNGLVNFALAEDMPNPICLKDKTWEEVKERVTSEVKNI
ncbi:MAG TPA: nucleotidyl transferase AbiEii/AbiGii toxin family protein [Flavisolibacter sp.]